MSKENNQDYISCEELCLANYYETGHMLDCECTDNNHNCDNGHCSCSTPEYSALVM